MSKQSHEQKEERCRSAAGAGKGAIVAERYALELEALAPVADIVEIQAQTSAEFAAAAADADAIITSWGIRIDAEVIAGLKQCVVIGVGSVGVDMVDVDAATAAGLVVTNVPDVFIEEVADHALMLLLASGRRTRIMQDMISNNRWFEGRPLLSHIPTALRADAWAAGIRQRGPLHSATRRAFGMRVIAHDPYVSELTISEAGVEPVSFDELLQRSDYLSVHAPLNAETHHLLNGDAFARMQPHAVIVNTARGPIICEEDLIKALRSGQIAAAGLDVLEQEPPAPDNPLLTMDNVILTPHVASATTRMRPETRRRVGREVALVLRGRWPMSCVNPTVLPRVPLERWQPYPMNRGPNR